MEYQQAIDIVKNLPESQKANSFRNAIFELYLRHDDNPINILETGTIRNGNLYSDGGSTRYWIEWIRPTNSRVYTIDLSRENLDFCKEIVGTHPNLYYVLGDSKLFLKDFNQEIHMLFLDSMDCEPPIDLTWKHQLAECELALPKMAERGLILIDDFNGMDRIVESKSAYSIPFLLSKGYKIINEDSHQILFSK